MAGSKDKLIATKEAWAKTGRGQSGDVGGGEGPSPTSPGRRRLPPGQHLVQGLPVLDLGEQPVVMPADWRFTVAGAITRQIAWDWKTFQSQPQTDITVDIHCVTTWTSYDNVFTGVRVSHLLDLIKPKEKAAFVMVRGFDGYSTNVPLSDLAAENALLAHSWNGAPLTREHGGPVRLIIPHLYFWKSAKWLRHLTFMEQDQPGFWEARGYHRRGEPFQEERYG